MTYIDLMIIFSLNNIAYILIKINYYEIMHYNPIVSLGLIQMKLAKITKRQHWILAFHSESPYNPLRSSIEHLRSCNVEQPCNTCCTISPSEENAY